MKKSTLLGSLITLLLLIPFSFAAACQSAEPPRPPVRHTPEARLDPTATTYYIAPTGSDSADGLSAATPWATFAHAYLFLQPGDTLMLLDGAYDQVLSPTVSGSPGLPITFLAQNRGQAVIAPTSDCGGISVFSTVDVTYSHLVFDGLFVRGHGECSAIELGSQDNVPEPQMTHDIIVRNTGAFGSANMSNTSVIDLGNNLRDSLLEDVWAYGFGRKAIQAFGSLRLTVRRAVVRYDYWDGSGYKPNDPRLAFGGYNTQYSTFEDIIAIDSAPAPPDREPDMAGFAATGNETPANVSGSAYNQYLGMMALDIYGNGLEVDGGSGDPTHDITFRDIIIWNIHAKGDGINVQGNDNGSDFSFVTVSGAEMVGFRLDPYPHAPITNETITNAMVKDNRFGYYYDPAEVTTFANNTGLNNAEDSDLEPQYAPTFEYIVRPEMMEGHERGGTMVKRYVDGVLTTEDLWPWPNEDLIKQQMCNAADLASVHRVAANGPGWEPAWCASDKTLTRYIWEYLGNPTPDYIYDTSSTYLPMITISAASASDVSLSWNHDGAMFDRYTIWEDTSPYFPQPGLQSPPVDAG